MLRARLAVAAAGLALLGAAPAQPPTVAPSCGLRPEAPSSRPHRVYRAGPSRCVEPVAARVAVWPLPVWVDVEAPFVPRRPARRHPGRR